MINQYAKALLSAYAKKMREALDSIYNKLETLDVEEDSYADEVISSVKSDIVAALYAPPRNCDVGTVAEQAERFRRFCETHKPYESQFTEEGELLCPSTGCELIACNYGQCALAWSQMPYEEGGAK